MAKQSIEEKHSRNSVDDVKKEKMKYEYREKRLSFIFASLNNLYTFASKLLTSTNFVLLLIFYLLFSGKIPPQDAVKLFDNVITLIAKDWTGHLLVVCIVVILLLVIAIVLIMKMKVKPLAKRAAELEALIHPQRKSSELSGDGFTNKRDK